MTDLLLELGQNRHARNLISRLGLPIPLPERLARATGPWRERELDDRLVAFGHAPGGRLAVAVADALARDGANTLLLGADPPLDAFAVPGEAWGRPARALDVLPTDQRLHALVFDATGVSNSAGLKTLYDFFHPILPALARSGRVIVLGAPPEGQPTPAARAAQAAIDGFVRSVAKEVGRRGATAQLVMVAKGAADRLAPVLRFLLSPRSAFITGQPLRVHADAAAAPAVPRVRPLEGQVALVTGAARGIGEATARRLAAEGARVVVLDRPSDDGPASRVAHAIGGALLLVDVSEPEAPATIARALADDHGGVDIVVHNAGVTRDKTLAKMDPPRWTQALAINLGAVVRITAALAAPEGPLRDHGRIIALSSIAGIAGNFGQTNYAAAKAGVIGYVAGLAPTLATRGIAVNAVAPGFIETRLTQAVPVMTREAARRMSALGQGGLPQDVAELITFLASPGAHGLTGGVIRVCGGNLVGA